MTDLNIYREIKKSPPSYKQYNSVENKVLKLSSVVFAEFLVIKTSKVS